MKVVSPRFRSLAMLLCVCCSLVASWSQAREAMTPSWEQGHYEVDQYVEYIEDAGWTFSQFLHQSDDLKLNQAPGQSLSFGYVNKAYWLRLRLTNADSLTRRWILEISGLGRAVDQIDAFIPDADGQYQQHRSGDSIPFADRTIRHHKILFTIDLPALASRTIFLKVKTNGSLQLPMTLWSADAYLEGEHNDTLLEGMFFGVLVIMLFYNAFIYWSVKDISYLFYVGYLTAVLGFAASIEGLGFEYFWPGSPEWNNKSNLLFAWASSMFVLLFARNFLKSAVYTPRVHRVTTNLLWIGVVCGALILPLSHSRSAALIALHCSGTMLLVILAASFSLKQGFTAARYFLLAWLSMLVSILFWVLNSGNVVSSYWVGAYLLQIGIALQVLLFSFALADRINLMRKEREAALKLQLAHARRLVDLSAMFERFVPRQFLAKIARAGIENIELGRADVAEVSMLFADVRGFTALAENLQPQELLNFLNAYLQRMDEVISRHDGFIDKFIGDGVMALFESQDPGFGALNAVHAAIDMQRAVDLYNTHRENSGYPPIQIGIGINTGEVVYGTVGSKERMDSTVLGDNVNVAARLQDLTKVLQARVVISEHTLELLGANHGLLVREVGDVEVRGRREPVHVFEVLNADPDVERHAKIESLADHEQAYQYFRQRDWGQAIDVWERCLSRNPDDKVVGYLIRKCKTKLN